MTSTIPSRRFLGIFSTAIGLAFIFGGAVRAADDGRIILFNGKDLTGWKLRNNSDETKNTWKVVSEVKLDANDPKNLVGSGEGGSADSAMLRGKIAHGSDIMTEQKFGDCELHVEFMVPRGSNSGVYLQGVYEIQILDSFGKQGNLSPGDCGGIYSTQAPSTNATKAPGQWQTLDVIFKAPRFDASGKKTADAEFVKVVLNGTTIHENVKAKGPTGGQISGEVPAGPLMFQGDHGIVAFRNVWIKR